MSDETDLGIMDVYGLARRREPRDLPGVVPGAPATSADVAATTGEPDRALHAVAPGDPSPPSPPTVQDLATAPASGGDQGGYDCYGRPTGVTPWGEPIHYRRVGDRIEADAVPAYGPTCSVCGQGSTVGVLWHRFGTWYHPGCRSPHAPDSTSESVPAALAGPGAHPVAEAGVVPAGPSDADTPAGARGADALTPAGAGPGESSAAVPAIPPASAAQPESTGGAVPGSGEGAGAGSGMAPPAPGDEPASAATSVASPPVDAASQAPSRRCDWCGTMGATVHYPPDDWSHPECSTEEFLRSTDHLSTDHLSSAPRRGAPSHGALGGADDSWDAALAGAELEAELATLRLQVRCVRAAARVLVAEERWRTVGEMFLAMTGGGE